MAIWLHSPVRWRGLMIALVGLSLIIAATSIRRMQLELWGFGFLVDTTLYLCGLSIIIVGIVNHLRYLYRIYKPKREAREKKRAKRGALVDLRLDDTAPKTSVAHGAAKSEED
jgi:hypothetical protein